MMTGLGQIGDINFVVEKEKIEEDLLIVAGDNLFNFSLSDAYDLFKKNWVHSESFVGIKIFQDCERMRERCC